MASIWELFVKISGDNSSYKRSMQESRGEADAFNATLTKLGQFSEVTGARLQRLGGILTASFTVPLTALGAASLKVAGDLEQNAVAFKTMMGSAEAASDHLNQLKDFALKTPFQFTDLTLASKRMQALGFEAKEVLPALRNIGDAASALGMGAEGMQRIVTALGQMKAKGAVQAEEMRQLAEAGIPAWQILAKTLNTDVAGAMKLVEQRAVSAGVAVPAILAGINEKFGGLMDEQSKTLLGQLSNFKDALTFALGDIGKTLAPTAKNVLDGFLQPVLDKLRDLTTAFAALPPAMQTTVIAAAALAAVSGPALYAIGGIATGLGSLSQLATLLPALLNPVALGIAAVGTVAAIAAYELSKHNEQYSAMDATFSKFLTGMVQMETNWEAAHKKLDKALSDGLITLREYNQALEILESREKKAVGAAFSTGISVKGWDGAKLNTPPPAASAMGEVDKFRPFLKTGDDVAVLIAREQEAIATHKTLIDAIAKSGQTVEEYFTGKWIVAAIAEGKFADQAGQDIPAVKGLYESVADILSDTSKEMDALGGATKKAHKEALVNSPWGQLAAGAEYFGITTAETYEKISANSQAAFDLMLESGVATQHDLAVAALMSAKAQIDADLAMGRVSKERHDEEMRQLDEELAKWGAATKRIERDRFDLSRELESMAHRTFTNIEREIARDIVQWKGWAESIKGIGRGLAEDFLSIMLKGLFKPLEDKFAKWAASLGTKLSDAVGKALGWGGSAASTASSSGTGVAGSAASSGASGGASSVGGAMGAINMVSGVVSAVSSVIGNFQMYGMNKSLDLIVKHTLQTANDMFNLRRDLWDQHNGMRAITNMIYDRMGDMWTTMQNGGTGGRSGVTFNNCSFTGSPDAIANAIFERAALAGA